MVILLPLVRTLGCLLVGDCDQSIRLRGHRWGSSLLVYTLGGIAEVCVSYFHHGLLLLFEIEFSACLRDFLQLDILRKEEIIHCLSILLHQFLLLADVLVEIALAFVWYRLRIALLKVWQLNLIIIIRDMPVKLFLVFTQLRTQIKFVLFILKPQFTSWFCWHLPAYLFRIWQGCRPFGKDIG